MQNRYPIRVKLNVKERVFLFYGIILGQSSEERFKISNTSKVPCNLTLNIHSRPLSRDANEKGKGGETIFDVKPKKLSIPPQEHAFVTVSFNPSSLRSYSAIFGSGLS